jgi:hypothetical protein
VFSSDLQLGVDDAHDVYADATVVWGAVRIKPGSSPGVENTRGVVEVLSESTEQYGNRDTVPANPDGLHAPGRSQEGIVPVMIEKGASSWCLWLSLAGAVACASKVPERPAAPPAETPAPPPPPPPAAAPAASGAASSGPNPERNAYFGELHLHTSWSFDAYAFQNTMTDPDAAYRFAKGEPITHVNGSQVQRRTPLDFAAVTDHAEYMGVAQLFTNPQHPLYQKPVAANLRSKDPAKGKQAYLELGGAIMGKTKPDPELIAPTVVGPIWKRVQQFAETHNAPGKFTTFVAFEWTSTPNSNNLHRNVIFGGTKVPELPFDSMQSSRPEDLWTYVEKARADGSDVLVIPHNANISGGLMFQTKDSDGKAFTKEYALRRQQLETLQEIIQLKGASETAPALAPNDEFAAFEQYPYQLGTGKQLPPGPGSFIREGYKAGLALGRSVGANPFKFGLVSGSDSHDGTAAPEEGNFNGGHGAFDKTPEARLIAKDPLADKTKWSAAGVTGVWAEENTRASIFAALKRKETYGTSGTFIRPRFFAGWSYEEQQLKGNDWVKAAYAGGVPMGSDLPAKPASAKAPTFVVAATKDPKSGNLDRIQIVKGWLDAAGKAQERIFEVALSHGRTVDAKTGKVPPVGNTVDLKTATYTNDIGDSSLFAVWSDPTFDATQPAFYYARVIEIPTPRWTTFDAIKLGIEPPKPATLQERAWTSPIWYTP